MKNRKILPSIRVYFQPDSKKLLEQLRADAKKYRVSLSTLVFYCIEYGLGYVEASFDDMKKTAAKK
jgi:hypothetical protein